MSRKKEKKRKGGENEQECEMQIKGGGMYKGRGGGKCKEREA